MESWIKTLGWIEFIVGIIVLCFVAFVSHIIIKYRHIEFNRYWRSRLLICGSAFIWVIALLLGNEFLWRPGEGLFGSDPQYYKYLCSLHVFFTVGSAEPLFFIVFLFILKSQTSNKSSSLYIEDPNYYVFKWSILWTIPIVVVHIVILILDASTISEPKKLFWTTFDSDQTKCAVPIISTAAFAIFFIIFLFFFFLISNRFSKTILNRNLINRIRFSIGSFILFLPLEVAIRVVLIFTLKIGDTSLALFHAFFFVDVIVVMIAIIEFALSPVLDSIGFEVNIRRFSITIRRFDKYGSYQSVLDEKDVISVHTGGNGAGGISTPPSEGIMTPVASKPTLTNLQKQDLKQKFMSSDLTIDDDDDDFNMGSSRGSDNINNNNNNNHVIEMDKLKQPKSPILERVRDSPDMGKPLVSPLSSPLSSTKTSPPNSSPTNSSSNGSGSGGGHERKKSRRFSLAYKKKPSTPSTPSPSNSPLNLSPLSQSPPNNNSNVRSMFQPTPVDDFRSQLMKYSNNKRF